MDENLKPEQEVIETENRTANKEKVVVQRRKPSIIMSILLILIGVLIGIIIMLLAYVLKTNELNTNKEDDTAIEQPQEEQQPVGEEPIAGEKELDLSIEGEFVKELNNKIIHSRRIYNVAYQSTLKSQNDLTQVEKMLFMLEKLKDEKKFIEMSAEGIINRLNPEKIYTTGVGANSYITVVQKFDIKDVESEYKYLYGADNNILKEDIETNLGYIYEYDEQDNCFYGHSYAGGGGFPYSYATSIYQCDAKDDKTEVYLYNYYIAIDDTNGAVYSEFEKNNKIGEVTVSIGNSERLYNGMSGTQILNSFKNSGAGKYKHTFRLDSAGNYYWYSCEPVK